MRNGLLRALCAAALSFAAWQDALACACCTNPGERTELAVPLDASHADELARLRFGGTAGTLSVARPRTISIFHVDPRSADTSREPVLYKEWRLTARAAGTGIFVPGLGPGQSLTLVLQGRGNNCTSAEQFTHWMLVMRGPKAKYHFFGGMAATP